MFAFISLGLDVSWCLCLLCILCFFGCVSNMCVCVYVCAFNVCVCVNSGCWKFIVLDVLSGSLFVLEVCCECFVSYGLCVFNVFSIVYA
jgi:hypothetical protein